MKLGFRLLLPALPLGACQTIIVNGIEVYPEHWNAARADLEARASYELGCPLPGLQFSLLNRHGKWPNVVGVDGCGRRAVYTRNVVTSPPFSHISGWMLSSAIETVPGAMPATPAAVEATPAFPAAVTAPPTAPAAVEATPVFPGAETAPPAAPATATPTPAAPGAAAGTPAAQAQ